MATARIRASWIDGDGFRTLWEPLPNADEFLLASCYVSQQGWEPLQTLLEGHLRRENFRATLVFSLSGLSEKSARFIVDRLYGLATDTRWGGRVVAYLINDRSAALFHPKAHASRSGTRTKLVVGSGNLTAGGMGGNLEMMSVVEDDLTSYEDFRQAIDELARKKVVRVDDSSIDVLRNNIAAEGLVAQDSTQKPRATKKGNVLALPLPAGDYSILLPPNADYLEALGGVRRLANQGAMLSRIDQLDPLSIAVPLTGFRDAGLLAVSKAQDLGAGLSYESGGGSIAVSLLPARVRERLKALTRPLGRLVGRFSIEMLGLRWMPLDWEPRLQQAWQEVVQRADVDAVDSEIEEHVSIIRKQLKSGKLKRQLADQLEVRRPKDWEEGSARRLLGWNEDRAWPVKLTDGLRHEVVDVVLQHITNTVGRRLTPDFPIMQLRQVGRGPRLRALAPETIDVVTALHFLAEWSIAGVVPRIRSASGELTHAPGRSGVVDVLARRFKADAFSAEDVFDTALRWQDGVAAENMNTAGVQASLAAAWSSFVNWFGLVPETTTWADRIPSWTVKSEEE